MPIPLLVAGGIAAAGSMAAAGIGAASNGARSAADEEARREMLARLDAIKAAQYSGEQYQTEQFSPEMYGSPEQAQYQLAQVDPRMRESQMGALSSLQDRFNGVADATQAADSYAAMNQGQRMAQGREGAIAQNAQMRGVGGSGLEFVMKQQAAQGAANQAQSGTLQAAQMSAMQKLAGQNSYLQGMGNLRGQDFQQEANNADIINRFNMHNTGVNNAVAMGNVDAKNKAGYYNNAAGAGDRAANIDRGDRNKNAKFNQDYQRAGGMNNVDSAANARQGQTADRNTALAAGAIQSGTNIAGSIVGGMNGGNSGGAVDSSGQQSTKYPWEKWGGK